MNKLYSLFLFLLISATLSSQPSIGSWQWARQAGGVYNTSNGQNEEVKDMCTDKYGNIYTTGSIFKNPYFNGQQFFSPFASFGVSDAYVAKYDKCGNLKWARFAGTTAGDVANEIIVDDSLNVYIVGFAGTNNAQFPDSAHTLTISSDGMFWAKYDSLGNIKWVKVANVLAQPSVFPRLTLKSNGNISGVIYLADTGTFYPGFSYHVTHQEHAIFEFDRNGHPVSMLPIDSGNSSTLLFNFQDLAYDQSGNMIFNYGILDTTRFFDTILNTPSYVPREFLFKVDRISHKIIWIRELRQDVNNQSVFDYIRIDDQNNIYANAYTGNNSVFNGDSIKFYSTAALQMTSLFKLDSNGITIWKQTADNTNQANVSVYARPYSLYGDSFICVPINVSGPTYWGGDTLNSIGPIGSGTDPYFLTFLSKTTGKLVFADSLKESNTLNTLIIKAITDEQGNILLGGYISAGLYAGNSIYNIGGKNDAFLLKWGLNCTDTDALIAPLSAEGLVANAGGTNAIDVDWQNVARYTDRYRVYRSIVDSLTGFALIDSVSKYTQHYTDVQITPGQIYWHRVSAVNNAGETYSNADSAVILSVGIAEAQTNIRHLSLYPNPANGYTEISVWSDASSPMASIISVTDMEGRQFYNRQTEIIQGKNDFIIDISAISTGMYVANIRVGNESYSKRLTVIK